MSLGSAYSLNSAEEAKAFYDRWAADYETELSENGYVTPLRCAQALADAASMPWAPLAEFGCGTGFGGAMLREHGFECIDGFDISPGMLEQARSKEIYRSLDIVDLSQPLDNIARDAYQNAAAIGVLNPKHMPATVIDEILNLLPEGGCFVFSLNDHALAEGTMETRLLELTEHGIADLVFKEFGDHLPGTGLTGCVYVLKKR